MATIFRSSCDAYQWQNSENGLSNGVQFFCSGLPRNSWEINETHLKVTVNPSQLLENLAMRDLAVHAY